MVQLKDIATIQTGVYIKPSPHAETLYLQLSDFDKDGNFIDRIVSHVSIPAKNDKHILSPKDLLFAAKGSNNMCIITPETNKTCVASPSFIVIRIKNKEKILPEYIAWYLNSPIIQNLLSNYALGTAIKSITKNILEDLEIPIPSVERQKAYIALDQLQKREQNIYKAIAEKHKQILDYKMIKNIGL